ncbi:MAG TPA: hypothetical protein VGN18_01575 [Jatrophihabitans sp.]|jgi:fibronectin type 3 domain-containing protein|uniref:fibronectin type III domain-containing protein n=1 Tax=Jatrophihabitans sp. TaxID=1932789 RepID=UPI002DFC1583|nr:hypothetical protein [Jatrophihabitans sp.]
MSTLRRFTAAAAGLGALASPVGQLLGAEAAGAAAAPGQELDNDWGRTAADIAADIAAQVAADPRVVAAQLRYQRALVAYATVKQHVRDDQAALARARTTATASDDAAAQHALTADQARVYPAASEVVASQLALVRTRAAVEAIVRSHRYIKAPYVAVPAQPSGVTAVGRSGQVSLSWAAVPGASEYRIFRDGAQIATTLVASFLDTGLVDGTAYAYQVRAVNVAGWSPRSVEVTAVPTPDAPAVPTGLAATPGDGQVSIAWTAVSGASGYALYRDGVLVSSPSAPAFTDTGLTDGTSYAYTVAALNSDVSSAPSAAVVAVPVAVAPAAPTGLIAAPGDGQVGLSWSPVPGATSYRVFRDGVGLASTVATTFADTGLSNGTRYAYTVVAYRANSVASTPSATVTATPVAPPLSTPTGVRATPGDGQVSVSWDPVGGATSYRVYRGATLVGSPTATTLTNTGLINGTTYSFTVVAVSAASSSAASAPVSATPAAAAPGAPTGLTGQAGDTTAALTWAPVTGATSYRVYRGGVLRTTVGPTSYTDTGLTNGTAYAYTVTAIKSGVESAASSAVSVTPVAVVPGTPAGVVAAPGDAQVTLTWNASANAASYRVYRDGLLVASPTGLTLTDTGLTNGTAYAYTVVAVNGTAVSAASAPATATPMAPAPAAPTGLVATAGNGAVTLNWTAVSGATSYRVYRGGTLVGSPSASSYADTGLVNGTTYSYSVVAMNTTTPSAASAPVTATPVKPPVSGTFTGAVASIANGHGTLRVVIVVTSNAITSATGTLLTYDSSDTVSINRNALPQYNTKTVAANSAAISKVTGATLTWAAYKTSLQSALTQAGL